MTRDSHRPTEDQDGEADVFSALWNAAPSFPQLPLDAPVELKALIVEVEEPRKVCSIYHASRRHGFQILVDRYVTQLRYGCRDPRCNTPTCFTCRRKLAGTVPLRRYNSTSARTLACFLAGQDNPEKSLCQYGGITLPKVPSNGRLVVSSKSGTSIDGTKTVQWSPKNPNGTRQTFGADGGRDQAGVQCENSRPSSRQSVLKNSGDKLLSSDEDMDIMNVRSIVRVLEQPVKKDHRSFIQNLFGTVAFRMLEWLAPKNLDAMISSEERPKSASGKSAKEGLNIVGTREGLETSRIDGQQSPTISLQPELLGPTSNAQRQMEPMPDSIKDSTPSPSARDRELSLSNLPKDATMPMQSPDLAAKSQRHANDLLDPNSQLPSAKHVNGSILRDAKDRNSIELGTSKTGYITGQNTQSDELGFQRTISAESQGILSSKRGPKRRTSMTISKPAAAEGDSLPYHGNSHPSIIGIPRRISVSKVLSSTADGDPRHVKDVQQPDNSLQRPLQQHLQAPKKAVASDSRLLPQSLSILPIEVIDILGNIADDHDLRKLDSRSSFCPYPKEGLRRARSTGTQENFDDRREISFQATSDTGPQWKPFIEQSLFYVLSSPKKLLQSFCEGNSLMDTQTLWYCMMRLISVNSSLVFDSLWIASADLYIPPRQLWGIYDWARHPRFLEAGGSPDYTNEEISRLMSIYFHALVASVPYVADSSKLFAISRNRSYGVSSIQARRASDASTNLYLLIDDVFSDDLTLRLARRLFAAIPARRQFQDLLKFNVSGGVTGIVGSSAPDILDVVLEPLNFLDIEVPPILDFTPEDRELHEKRAPTLLVDWARAVMLQDWTGRAEVDAEGPFGGALAMISAIYEKRKSLLLGDVHFRTEYFADRLDSTEMPIEWLSFTPNKKTLHLLDFPYLFNPATLVSYFRAINFSRMSRSFEASGSMMSRIQTTMAPQALMTNAIRRDDLFKRLRTAVSKFLVLNIRRDNVLVDAFNHLWRREQRELSRPLKVRLGEDSGEEGSDSGGVQQEFFRLAIAEALNPDYGAFTIDERTRMTWFQPGSPQPLWKFELIGLIISLAIYNGLTLPVTFPRTLYRKLLGASVTELHHIEDGWPDLASGLTALLEWDERDGAVSDVFSRTYEFSVDSFGQQVSRDMSADTHWPQFGESASSSPEDAPLVDGYNRNDYVTDYILWLTDISIRPQFEAFERGFLTCLDRRSLSLFDPETLQSIVEGVQEIDISELRRYTRYVGWDANHKSVKDFWSIVKKFDANEKKKLLEFVTASDRLPVGGMRNLQFVVQRNGVGDIDGHLPTSYTCYGTLLLPEYSSKDVLREKLGMALENAKGFGFA